MTDVIRILLVEDSSECREVIRFAIEGEPKMRLLKPFGTAEMALGTYRKTGASSFPPDVILLDLRLPGMSGLEAIPFFREILPDARIIVLSQSDDEANVLQSVALGAVGYLLKSATVQEIKQAVQAVADGGGVLDAKIAQHLFNALKADPLRAVAANIISARERQVLELLAEGLQKKEIAGQLGIEYSTVDAHVRHIYGKLDVNNAPAAVRKAYEMGIFTP